MTVQVTIEGKRLKMDVDTGPAVSVITQKQWKQLQIHATVRPTPIKLQTYSMQVLHPLGCAKVKVSYKGQAKRLPLYILRNGGPPLFGRDWITHLGMPDIIKNPCNTLTVPSGHDDGWVESLKQRFPEVFVDELGKIKNDCVRLKLKPDAHPKFFKAWTVPFALRAGVDAELIRLEEQGVISKVERSAWASPIVPVKKSNGELRICGDFRMVLNSQLEVDQYPLPRVDDIFASLAGGQKFTKIDLRQAYLQFEVHPSSRKYLTINTHRGLYEYNRMVFGIASAPAIWQRKMDEILADIPFTQCLLDDMLITGRTDQEHKQNVELVLQRLQDQGLKVNLTKCKFMVPKLEFCGHLVDAEGIHTAEDKVDALVKAPAPTSLHQLRSYLGLLNYYNKFLPDLAHTLFPMHKLLEKHSRWDWSAKCQHAFESSKRKLLASRMLVHYDLQKPLTLACDASPYGLGAVLSHILPDGSEKPVAFASRSLTKTESNYSQIDKEAFALIWAIRKFHLYLYGRKFTILTDHKPLLQIFSPDKGISQTTAARLQRYALFLGANSYRIQYRSHDDNANADAMSRLTELPLQSTPSVKSCRYTTSHLLTSREIAAHTVKDTLLTNVLTFIRDGWPATVSQEHEPYYRKRMELFVKDNCVLWGDRVVILQTLQRHILDLLHTGHPGTTRMKQKARGYVWWPNIDADITAYVNACVGCAQTARDPPRGCIQPWTWPTVLWFRLHLDFAGPIRGQTFLIIIDAHSKWPEVIPVTQLTTKATVAILLHLFASFGYPREIVTDNGAQFTSQEFQSFVTVHNIKHKLTAPYHPATNGQAERFVQTFKNYFKASVAVTSQRSISPQQLDSFLFTYRTTPHATTGTTPAELMLGRQPWTAFDMLRPQTVHEHVLQSQEKMVKSKESPVFATHQEVWTRSYGSANTRWLPATVAESLGPKMYRVRLEDGSITRRHVDQLRSRSRVPEPLTSPTLWGPVSTSNASEDIWNGVWVDSETLDSSPVGICDSGSEVPPDPSVPSLTPPVDLSSNPTATNIPPAGGRPQRHRRPPDRLLLQERIRDFRRSSRRARKDVDDDLAPQFSSED
uniref:Gypsy retrotransposon integrase-like protein 1 n=1 Tax=Leptobrachium leishanense TaxID=445787 RepID=A0A8C5PIS1_9ANUR